MTQEIRQDVKFKNIGCMITGFKNVSDKSVVTDLIIPDEIDGFPIVAIGPSAFKGCTALKRVRVGINTRIIENKAFYGCKALESVDLSGSVKRIGAYAFERCTGLKKVTLGAKLTTVFGCAFKDCNSVDEVVYYGDQEAWQEIDFFNESANPAQKGIKIVFIKK